MTEKIERDEQLIEALTKAYMVRAKLFHEGVKASQIDLLIAEIDHIDPGKLVWNKSDLGISDSAFMRVRQAEVQPHQVFAHPTIIEERPHLIAYYRNLVAISKKGISQLVVSTNSYEARRKTSMSPHAAQSICSVLNRILSGVIDGIEDYCLDLSRQTILAEIGTELQGTWNNVVGQGAAKAVERLLGEYIDANHLGPKVEGRGFHLNNGWRIDFGSEPDVAFFDPDDIKRIVIEIKGSLDKNGAQTRYGEAKKTFAKQLVENPRCHTIYLASCFTDAVIQQIKKDGQVREWYNLTSILYDEEERQRFLERLFHIINAPK